MQSMLSVSVTLLLDSLHKTIGTVGRTAFAAGFSMARSKSRFAHVATNLFLFTILATCNVNQADGDGTGNNTQDGEGSPDPEKLAEEIMKMWHESYAAIRPGLADGLVWDEGRMGGLPNHPRPPHLHDCAAVARDQRFLDTRGPSGSLPRWSFLGGSTALGLEQRLEDQKEENLLREERKILLAGEYEFTAPAEKAQEMIGTNPGPGIMGPLPPWVEGADEDNLVLTRRLQRDLWVHQHPKNCSAPGVRFLVANITHDTHKKTGRLVHLGLGAHMMVIATLLGEAVKQGRVLVIQHHIRADHDLCHGNLRGKWECYFAPETSSECRERALEALKLDKTEQREGEDAPFPVATHWGNQSYSYYGRAPEVWGKAWENIHPTAMVEGHLVRHTRDDSHRWFRAQALRYLMRYPSTRVCHLVNRARHAAFGSEAALASAEALLAAGQTSVLDTNKPSPLEPFWSRVPGGLFHGKSHLISMHVRQGDKSREMVIHPFSHHMALAGEVRLRFPTAGSIWLSTEMQTVIDDSRNYKGWRFYYTNVSRQGSIGVANGDYEGSFGLGRSTDNAIVNTLIAASCDFFVGTMGSTSSAIIDDLRRTSGRESRGLLSVNKDRAWMSRAERVSHNLVL